MYENTNGLLLKVSVSNSCSGCGACSALCDCFIDGPDGKAIPANGGCLSKKMLSAIQEAQENCPENAIMCVFGSMVKHHGTVTREDLKTFIQKNLIEYQYPRPDYKDYAWTCYRPDVNGEGFISWTRYKYSSFEKAKRAGINELQRVIFDRINTYAAQALIEYKHHKLTPLITYEETDSNFYYREKMRMQQMLSGLLEEIEAVTGKTLENKRILEAINMVPDFGYRGKKFDAFTQIEERTGLVKGDLHGASYYDSWIDEDSLEEYAGTGFLGDKYVTKWAYNAHDAVRQISDDLNYGAKDEIPDFFRSTINSSYQFGALVKPIEEEIHSLAHKLLTALDAIPLEHAANSAQHKAKDSSGMQQAENHTKFSENANFLDIGALSNLAIHHQASVMYEFVCTIFADVLTEDFKDMFRFAFESKDYELFNICLKDLAYDYCDGINEEDDDFNERIAYALLLFGMAGNLGDFFAAYEAAVLYYRIKEYDMAIAWMNQCVQLDESSSMKCILGEMYSSLGDYQNAEKWLKLSLEQGYSEAREEYDYVLKKLRGEKIYGPSRRYEF